MVDAGKYGFVGQLQGSMRMREPEPVTNFVNKNVVTGAAGLK